mgnify:CR=1 FL=1
MQKPTALVIGAGIGRDFERRFPVGVQQKHPHLAAIAGVEVLLRR